MRVSECEETKKTKGGVAWVVFVIGAVLVLIGGMMGK